MSMFEIYLIIQLDVISKFLCVSALCFLFIASLLIGIVYEYNLKRIKKKTIVTLLTIECFLVLLAVLTPNTKTAITMVAGEKITNNPALIESADKGAKLLPKVIDAVDVYLKKKGASND